MKARIAGIGAYAPERVVTNDQLSEIVDTSDEWIQKPQFKHIGTADLHRGDHQGDLAAEAARRALKAAGVDAGSWTSSSWEPRRQITIIPATHAASRP